MNRTKMIEEAVLITGMTKKDTEEALNAFLQVIEKALVSDNPVSILGFGCLTVKTKPVHFRRNLRTNEMEQIPAKKWIKFKAGNKLLAKINSPIEDNNSNHPFKG